MTTKFSSREFNQAINRAKKAADTAPVVITARGKPAYVLLNHDAYRRLVEGGPSILDMLYLPGAEDIEFDPPTIGNSKFRIPDLT